MQEARFKLDECERCNEPVPPKNHGSRIVKVCEKCNHVSIRHRSLYGQPCCETTDIRFIYQKRKNSVGYKQQCFSCGKVYEDLIKKRETEGSEIYPLNEELKQNFREQERIYNQQLSGLVKQYSYKQHVQRKETWFEEEYNEYLNSEKWQSKRLKVLHRDGYICQACCTRKAVQVHHKSYRFVGDEPLYHLISVCLPCHEKIDHLKSLKVKGEYHLDETSESE